jgi:hypothetical protein
VLKVFVVNDGGHDFSAAKQYGELVFCTKGTLSKYDVGQMFRELSEAMEGSHIDDYILLTSLTTLCSVASAIFAAKHGRVNFLIFKDDGYVERKVVLVDEGVQNVTRSGR